MVVNRKESQQIHRLRKQVDQADRRLLGSLNVRFDSVKEIARIKKIIGLPVLQKSRWQELIKNRVQVAQKEFKLDPRFTKKLFTLIHEEALRMQRKIVRRSRKRSCLVGREE